MGEGRDMSGKICGGVGAGRYVADRAETGFELRGELGKHAEYVEEGEDVGVHALVFEGWMHGDNEAACGAFCQTMSDSAH